MSVSFDLDGQTILLPLTASNRLKTDVVEIVGSGHINRRNIVGILLSLVQLVESYDMLSGIQKKALVLRTVNSLIDEHIDDNQEAMELKLLVQLTLPSVIDTFISLDKGEVVIKVKKTLRSIFCCT